MTHKEKAKQLVYKYHDLFHVDLENSISISESKQCALVLVDEILNENIYHNIGLGWDNRIKYWEQVKQEIQNI